MRRKLLILKLTRLIEILGEMGETPDNQLIRELNEKLNYGHDAKLDYSLANIQDCVRL